MTKRVVWLGLALVGLLAATEVAQARGCRVSCAANYGGCAPAYAPACTVSYVDKEVTAYRPVWKERDVQVTVLKPAYRDEVKDYTTTVLVPEWKEEKRECWVYNRVPTQVVRDVTCCRMVPVCTVDPCTGCVRTSCRPETYVQQVTCTQWNVVPEKKEYMVKVCSYRQEEKKYQVKYTVCEYQKSVENRKERYCVMEEYKTMVQVPVYTPVAPCVTLAVAGCCN